MAGRKKAVEKAEEAELTPAESEAVEVENAAEESVQDAGNTDPSGKNAQSAEDTIQQASREENLKRELIPDTESEAPKNSAMAIPRVSEKPAREDYSDRMIGVFTEDWTDEGKAEETAEQRFRSHWKQASRMMQTKGLAWAVIKGIESTDTGRLRVITSLYDERCVIPESQFWMPNMRFRRNYDEFSTEAQTGIRLERARQMLGAIIPVVIAGMQKTHVADDPDNGVFEHDEITLAGSRVMGMEILQDYWFWHEKGAKDAVYGEVKRGDIYKHAHVLSVAENSIFVEAYGTEATIQMRDLTMSCFIENCHDYYHAGDTLPAVKVVKVRARKTPEETEIYLDLSVRQAETLSTAQDYLNIQNRGIYLGRVTHISGTGKYHILLQTGVPCVVNRENVAKLIPLNPGDMVNVVITGKNDELRLCYGYAQKV